VKRFGKYFLKECPASEFKEYAKKHYAILHDVKTDKDVLEFFQKIRMTLIKPVWSGPRIFYVPDLNNGKEAAIIGVGHHTVHDAVTQF
jgi:hypothetical protein